MNHVASLVMTSPDVANDALPAGLRANDDPGDFDQAGRYLVGGRGGRAVGMDGADLFGEVAQGLHGPGELPCVGRAGSAPDTEDGAEGFNEADQRLDGPGWSRG
ncbi:MAG TPA: hypothetical protein VF286_05440 [Acidiphilium sp.]